MIKIIKIIQYVSYYYEPNWVGRMYNSLLTWQTWAVSYWDRDYGFNSRISFDVSWTSWKKNKK